MTAGSAKYLLGLDKLTMVDPTDLHILQQLDPPIYGEILIPAGTTFELSNQEQAFAGENVGFVSADGAGVSS